MNAAQQEQTPQETPSHQERAELLKTTLDQIVIDLDPSYGEVEERDRDLYISVLEHALVELNELAEDFD